MRKWIGIGVILIGIGIAGFLSPWSNWRHNWDTIKVDEQSSVSAEGVKRIAVHTDSENVRLARGAGDDVKIRVKGRVMEKRWSDQNVIAVVTDGTLDIRMKPTDSVMGYNIYELSMTIEVPSRQYESLVMKTDSGDIALDGLTIDDMKLNTDSGDLVFEGIAAKTIAIGTDSGDTAFTNTEGALVLKSDSGDIAWTGKQLEWAVDIATDSGDVYYKADQEPVNGTIRYESDSGDGLIERGDKKTQTGSSITEEHGSGAPLISVKTDSGDFVLTSN
ncbi:DUF4097 family beta strand repeat protein [Paenibacillus sp. PR3]|uniref:DUF4097 family beta strand repeat protein n=1 Tax=Paenibacillus terricola TaxID=2763503 RepID=A0ABR8MXF2_9BACL|nr:DUF4097 family beta strand repeat-containing protein [Paenibacillus terricola]MBD3920622.1 DUF4097 family beta strand repeat protein [Paenibacillus terricola]